MVRIVRFKPAFRVNGAGGDAGLAIYSFAATYTSRNHSAGGGMTVEAPNIEVTVPDNWGGNTLSIAQQHLINENDNFPLHGTYMSPLASSITMNIIIKAHGNIDTYYKLRDRFVRMWGSGIFTVNIFTGNYHGGNQYVDGYFSSIDFSEFRTSNDVSGTAVFTPITPWYFEYSNGDERLPFGDCPVLGGKPRIDGEGYAILNCNFVEFRRIYPVKGAKADGIKIISADPSDPLHINVENIMSIDIGLNNIASCSLCGSYITTYDDNGVVVNQFDLLPKGLLGIGLDPRTKVRFLHYSETYTAPAVFPDKNIPPLPGPDDYLG